MVPGCRPEEVLQVVGGGRRGSRFHISIDRDGGSVTVRAYHEGEWVRIDVKDTGIGIATENLDQVFTEFFREKRRETKGLEGSGLGLAIVKRLTERAGGRVQLTSEQGKGSTFSVLLPA